MTEIHEIRAHSGHEASPPPPTERDDADTDETLPGPGDGTEGPDAPSEPGPRPPGFPDPAGNDEDVSG